MNNQDKADVLTELELTLKDTKRFLRQNNIDRPTLTEFIDQFQECLKTRIRTLPKSN